MLLIHICLTLFRCEYCAGDALSGRGIGHYLLCIWQYLATTNTLKNAGTNTCEGIFNVEHLKKIIATERSDRQLRATALPCCTTTYIFLIQERKNEFYAKEVCNSSEIVNYNNLVLLGCKRKVSAILVKGQLRERNFPPQIRCKE